MSLYEPLSKAQRSELRESILTNGVREPVLVSSLSGRVLSGENRVAICEELGLPYETRVVQCDDETAELIVQIEHNPQRRVRKAGQDRAVQLLRARGWSTRRIADVLGIDQATVVRAPADAPASAGAVGRTVSADGRRHPARKYTAQETTRRDDLIEELWLDNYRREDITVALDCGNGAISDVVKARGLLSPRPTLRAGPPPSQPQWWDDTPRQPPRPLPEMPEPAAAPRKLPPVPTYRGPLSVGAEVARIRDLYRVDRWALLACHDANEAEALGDTQWSQDLQTSLQQLVGDLQRLVEVIRDPKYRAAQIVMMNGAPPPAPLRVVQ